MTSKLIAYLRYASLFLRKNHDPKTKYAAFRVVTKLGQRLLPQYRFTFPEMEWWHNASFNEYLARFDEAHGFNTHRKWMLKQLLRLTAAVEGDTAECGVYRGASSWLILQANAKARSSAPKVHYLFDSFEGLSEPDSRDGSHWRRGSLMAGVDEVVRNLLPFEVGKSYKICKGWIPDRFHEVEANTFSFVHIDVDLYQPTLDSVQFFYPRLSSGGVLVCDDYGFDTCPGATRAIDEFLADKEEKMISLADGGGFFVKGVHISPDL